jgi:hypothetical protein
MNKIAKDINYFKGCIYHWEEAFLSTFRKKRKDSEIYVSDSFANFCYCYTALPQIRPIY